MKKKFKLLKKKFEDFLKNILWIFPQKEWQKQPKSMQVWLMLFHLHPKILSNSQEDWCKFGRKKWHLKKNKDCPLLKFECFKQAKKTFICVEIWACKLCNERKIFQKDYDNPNYYELPLWFFKHTKMQF